MNDNPGIFNDPQQREEYQNFVTRYGQGMPWEGYQDGEVMQRYQQVAPQLPPAEYQQAAQAAFAQMPPQQRAQFGQWLQSQAQQQNLPFVDFNRDGIDDRLQDPTYLAQVTAQLQQQQPGLLPQVLSGGNPMGRGLLAGIASFAAQRLMGGFGGSMGGYGYGDDHHHHHDDHHHHGHHDD